MSDVASHVVTPWPTPFRFRLELARLFAFSVDPFQVRFPILLQQGRKSHGVTWQPALSLAVRMFPLPQSGWQHGFTLWLQGEASYAVPLDRPEVLDYRFDLSGAPGLQSRVLDGNPVYLRAAIVLGI